MNILILSGSPRKDGNTELLAEAFAKGAAAHHHMEIVSVLFDAILAEYNLCLKFFSIEDAGKVLARGVKDKGDIMGTSFLEDAYQLGTSI